MSPILNYLINMHISSKYKTIQQKLIPFMLNRIRSRREIESYTGLSKRQLSRYLNSLRSLNYTITTFGKKNKTFLLSSQGEFKIPANSLRLLKDITKILKGQGYITQMEELETLIEALTKKVNEADIDSTVASFASNELFLYHPGPTGHKELNENLYKLIYSAAAANSEIRLTYKKPGENALQRFLFEPLGLTMRVGKMYCVGKKVGTDYVSVLPLSRIVSVSRSGRTYQRNRFCLKSFFQYSFGTFPHEKPDNIKIRINALETDFMWIYLNETYIHHSIKKEFKKRIGYITMKVGVDHELAGWILSWGEKMTVMAPKKLVNLISDIDRVKIETLKKGL